MVDTAGDVVTEARQRGHRHCAEQSSAYTLGANVENLTLTGAAAINGTGNTLDNVLTGNSGNNVLNGGAGNDTMTGGTGQRHLCGRRGRRCGHRDRRRRHRHGAEQRSAYALGANVENLTLTGTAAINGTGNALDNALTGNTGNNVAQTAAPATTR